MLASSKLGHTMESFKVDYMNLPSDHFLLTALIWIPHERVRNWGQKKTQRRFKLEKLIFKSSDATKKLYQDELTTAFTGAFTGFDTADFNNITCPAKFGTANYCCAVAANFVHRTNTACHCEKSVGSASSGGKFIK
jgi:hypothetical protein